MRDRFLPQHDELGSLINDQASDLYTRLLSLPVDRLGLPEHCLYYFKTSHFNRLFFSIETSAHLLYRSIKLVNKALPNIVIMDYGAGVGTLYMLARMIGCKQVIYNDFLEEWRISALKIAEAISVQVDEYILGDIDDTLRSLDQKNIRCDIITSRNVIEHVYKLDYFYGSIHKYQPQALIYSSTTANIYNPGAHIKHVLWHRKWEKEYFKRRLEIIRSTGLLSDTGKEEKLARKTRGLAGEDLLNVIKQYATSGATPDPSRHYSNCCQPDTGVWAEHLLTFDQYREFVGTEKYFIRFLPGFWDTHYSNSWKNIFSELLNFLIRVTGRAGIVLAPFIYVIATPQKQTKMKNS